MKIIPHLWYTDNAEEAASFYASVLPNSKVECVTVLPVESPSGPAGSVKVVEFTLVGQPFMAIVQGRWIHSIIPYRSWWNATIRQKLTGFGRRFRTGAKSSNVDG
jgi:hypothetical protein